MIYPCFSCAAPFRAHHNVRYGRLGVCFVTVSAVCIWQGARIFLPDRQSKRARELEIKRDARAEKEQVGGDYIQ